MDDLINHHSQETTRIHQAQEYGAGGYVVRPVGEVAEVCPEDSRYETDGCENDGKEPPLYDPKELL